MIQILSAIVYRCLGLPRPHAWRAISHPFSSCRSAKATPRRPFIDYVHAGIVRGASLPGFLAEREKCLAHSLTRSESGGGGGFLDTLVMLIKNVTFFLLAYLAAHEVSNVPCLRPNASSASSSSFAAALSLTSKRDYFHANQ